MSDEKDLDCKINCVRGKVREMCYKDGRLVTNRQLEGRCEKKGKITEDDILQD